MNAHPQQAVSGKTLRKASMLIETKLRRSYDERQPPEPKYPSVKPSTADFVADEIRGDESGERETNEHGNELFGDESAELTHAPPGPAYDGLTNNISTVLQELKGHPWKKGTDDFVNVRVVGDYLQEFSKTFEVQPLIEFNTRVEKLEKIGDKWRLRSSTLVLTGAQRGEKIRNTEVCNTALIQWEKLTRSRCSMP
jgi:hypothetical protein